MYAILCDQFGNRLLGSDGVIRIDVRKKTKNRIAEAAEYRERFRKHFSHKYRLWTHAYFVRTIGEIDNNNTTLHNL